MFFGYFIVGFSFGICCFICDKNNDVLLVFNLVVVGRSLFWSGRVEGVLGLKCVICLFVCLGWDDIREGSLI